MPECGSQRCGSLVVWNGVVKSRRLPAKIAACLVSIGQLLCLAVLYIWCFLNKISLDWPLSLTTQPSTSKLSDNPDGSVVISSLVPGPNGVQMTLNFSD